MAVNACFGNCTAYPIGLRPHNGIDLNAPMNTYVRAAGQGTVTWAGRASDTSTLRTYGKYIDIVHTNENPQTTGSNDKFIKTRYAHLDSVDKYSGSTVSNGTTIGKSGKSGYKDLGGGVIDYNLYAAHLHFEVLVGPYNTGSNWTRVQPLKYYPGKTCACGISFNSFSTDVSNIANIRSIGIFVNEEYFIDVESLLSMSSKELERYGISDDKVAKFNELIKSDEEIYNIYNDKLEMLIQSN